MGQKVLRLKDETELKAKISDMMGGWNGSQSTKADNQKAFRMYQHELMDLWMRTSKEEKDRLKGVAALWNQIGPPAKQQAKYVYLTVSRIEVDFCIGMPQKRTNMCDHSARR
jgi:hypothetical protein